MQDRNPEKQQRFRRRRRQDMYCYEIQDGKPNTSNEQSFNNLQLDIVSEEQDGQYEWGHHTKIKKNQKKKKKIKAKNILNKNKQQLQSKATVISHKNQQSNTNVQYRDYDPSQKNKIQVKMFNPELYIENILQKKQYEKQLHNIHEEYGRKIQKLQAPSMPLNSWGYLLKQAEEVGKDFESEREERIKLKRKLAKFSQSVYNRMEQIQEQRIKQQEKKVRKQSLELFRHVKRQFWGNAIKINKIIYQQDLRKMQKQNKMKKLEDLVTKQFQASQKITKILQGYKEVKLDHIQVSQNTQVPVIIDIQIKPKCKYLGLHEDNVIRPSLLIKFPLRDYQLLGVYWISTLHNRGMNAILADQMGLGKTIQTIALLAHLAIEKGIWGPHLVIVPTTILMNWEIQFKRWCPAFKIMTYFGSPKQRKQKRKGWSKLNSFHVCITSYKIAVTENPIFRRKKWYYMVLDEAQNIKNFKSQRWQVLLNFKSHNRLLLTGTPLQNDLTELWSLLHFLMPKVFNSFDDFNQWFNIPFQQALEKNFPISQEILKKLHTILRPFFLRRLKKDVQTQLPKKTQSIIRCGMSRRQKYLYDEIIWHENYRQRKKQSSGMMNVLMGLKKICNHPDLFQPRIEESPLSWVPLTILIAHHMFLSEYFQTYKTHILQDFVTDFKAQFQQIAQGVLSTYQSCNINADNQIYYRKKYADRLIFAKVNFERSKRKPFKLYNFDLNKLQVSNIQLPYYMSKTLINRTKQFESIFDKFLFIVPKVMARPATLATFPMSSALQSQNNRMEYLKIKVKRMIPIEMENIRAKFLLHFPSKSIILYDSGKLIKLQFLLKAIKYRGQKALVFTQMTKMLDIFQKMLNMFKYNYVRLDGNTKTQLRQTIVQRFNNDPKILCFISSTRSGGIGLNLTGASNVVFYDTDWNPAMDKQAQDRCHRIGQTRSVIIYRLITQHSVEENILMKSIQKRKLQSLVTEQGMFDTSYFEKVSLKGLLKGAISYHDDQQVDLAQVEDQQDRELLRAAEKQNRENKEEEQEQLDITMLPKLFNYGLKVLNNSQNVDEISDDISEELISDENSEVSSENDKQQNNQQNDQQENDDDDAIDNVPSQRQNLTLKVLLKSSVRNEMNQDKSSIKQQQYKEQSVKEDSVFEEKEQHYSISTLQKLKAMSVYQTQYLLMKQHFSQLQTNIAIEQQFPIKQKQKLKHKIKNKRKYKH